MSYEQVLRVHLIPNLGATPLAQLQPAQVQAFLNRQTESGLAPRTVRYHREVLRNALNFGVRTQLVTRNVAAVAEGPRVVRRQAASLTPDEARIFIDSLAGHRLRALFMTALGTGLRQGEVLGLSWADVDLDGATLTVRSALQRVDGHLTLVPPKSESSKRIVPLPAFVIDELRHHRANQLLQRLGIGDRWPEIGLVFTTSVGTPMDGPAVTRSFKAALRAAGLEERRFHDLRHSYTSLLIATGTPIRVAMELLGHSDARLTMNIYGRVYPQLGRVAADGIGDLLSRRDVVAVDRGA